MPAYSRYLFDKRLSLQPCIAVAYNEDSNTYTIRWVLKGTQQCNLEGTECENRLCHLTVKLTDYNGAEGTNYVHQDIIVPDNISSKKVKRLNLLFAHESEAMWFRRREAARFTRRMVEREMNMRQFLAQNVRMAAKLREYIANREIQLEFKITRLLEFLADVAGITSEIIDNIFNERVLYNKQFKRRFLDRLDEREFQNVLKRSGEIIQEVSNNFVCANMICTIDYLRRNRLFEDSLQSLNISQASYVTQLGKNMQRLSRYIGTLSGEFEQNPVKALNSYDTRLHRINTIYFAGNTQYNTAYLLMKQTMQELYTMKGLYLFNFAAITPYLSPDQIYLVVKEQFNGGASKDKESHQIFIGSNPNQMASSGTQDVSQSQQ